MAVWRKCWQIVGLLSIPWGRTLHWNHCKGRELLMTRREIAKCFRSFSTKGNVKKQSFRWIIKSGQSFGMQAGLETPGYRGPIGCRVSLIFLRSWISLHLPDFFGTTKIGVFQGLLEGSIWPASNCSLTKRQVCSSRSPLSGHWSTHTRRVGEPGKW